MAHLGVQLLLGVQVSPESPFTHMWVKSNGLTSQHMDSSKWEASVVIAMDVIQQNVSLKLRPFM